MTTLVGQIRLEAKIFLRGKQNVFMTLAFPVIMILIFGAVFSSQTWSGVPAINYLIPGIIVMALMMVCMNNNAIKVVGEREKGIYRRLSLTPLKKQTLLLGDIFVRYAIVIVGTMLLTAVGTVVFKAHLDVSHFLFWFVLTLGTLTFIAIGFVLTSIAKNTNSMMTIGMAVLFPFMFLGACYWPLEQMPTFIRPFCEALPTLHLNAALRMIAIQGAGFSQIWPELPVLLAWLVGSSVLAVKCFKWE